jgi:14-3-3 protein epsilon
MTTEREANIYEAKLAEQAERYDEMVAAIKKVAASLKANEGLSVEERNIFSVAYKNVIGSRRATWRIVSSILKKEEDRPEKIEMRIKHARALANKVEGEMNSICNDCLKVIDDHLLPSAASDAESKTFYYKMYVHSFRFVDASPPLYSFGRRFRSSSLSFFYFLFIARLVVASLIFVAPR